jgi:hypothetical protein
MQDSTSIRVSRSTRDLLRELADGDGLTLDDEIRLLARAERQRRIGRALASADLTSDETRWLELGLTTTAETHESR